MCLAETTDAVRHRHEHGPETQLGRRRFLMGGGALAAGAALAATAPSLPAAGSPSRHRHGRRLVDLTHRLVRDFPSALAAPADARPLLACRLAPERPDC